MIADDSEASRRADTNLILFRQLLMAKLAAMKLHQPTEKPSTPAQTEVNGDVQQKAPHMAQTKGSSKLTIIKLHQPTEKPSMPGSRQANGDVDTDQQKVAHMAQTRGSSQSKMAACDGVKHGSEEQKKHSDSVDNIEGEFEKDQTSLKSKVVQNGISSRPLTCGDETIGDTTANEGGHSSINTNNNHEKQSRHSSGMNGSTTNGIDIQTEASMFSKSSDNRDEIKDLCVGSSVSVRENSMATESNTSSGSPSGPIRPDSSVAENGCISKSDADSLREVIEQLKSGRDDLIDTYKINSIVDILTKKRQARLKQASRTGRRLQVDPSDIPLLKHLLVLQIRAKEKKDQKKKKNEKSKNLPENETENRSTTPKGLRETSVVKEDITEDVGVKGDITEDIEVKEDIIEDVEVKEDITEDVGVEEDITEDVGVNEDIIEDIKFKKDITEDIKRFDEGNKPEKALKLDLPVTPAAKPAKSKRLKQLKRQDSKIKKSTARRPLNKAQRDSLLRKALCDATLEGLRIPLEEAILDFLHFKVKDKYGDLPRAMAKLDMVKTQNALEDALEKRNSERVQYAIAYCERRDYKQAMKPILQKANTFMVERSQEEVFNSRHLVKNSSEIRRYQYPQEVIHAVIKATLLLLQEPEGKTKKWTRCQALLTPLGSNGLYKKTRTFEVDALHSQIVARAKSLLADIQEEDVTGTSGCLEALYKWSIAMIEEYEIRNGAVDEVKPASRRSQRSIMRKLTGDVICRDTYKPLVLPVLAFVNTGGEAMERIQNLPQWSLPRELRKAILPSGGDPTSTHTNRTSSLIITGKNQSRKTKAKPKDLKLKQKSDLHGEIPLVGNIQVHTQEEKDPGDLDQSVENSTGTSGGGGANTSGESSVDLEFSDQPASGFFGAEESDTFNLSTINRRGRNRSNSLIVSSDGWKREKMYPRQRRGTQPSLLPLIDGRPLIGRKD